MEWIELDGSQGEGGGQILRTSLALSMITGKPFRMNKIRARRAKSGLLRQHLTAVRAAKEVCDAELEGDELGSSRLVFKPGKIRAGDYTFSIGSAGSCTLVLQTVLPALLFADGKSQVSVSGGTHNPAAPPADFLIRTWQPLLQRMGIDLDIKLVRHGFFPAGGGRVSAVISPCTSLRALELIKRGGLRSIHAVSAVAAIPASVAERELNVIKKRFPEATLEFRKLPDSEGPGNALMVELDYENIVEVFCGFGQKGVSAETVAKRLINELDDYMNAPAAVGEYLADQLLIPIALAGSGKFTTNVLSSHLQTNVEVIEKFLPVKFSIDTDKQGVTVQLADKNL